jgi:hypothetical protein
VSNKSIQNNFNTLTRHLSNLNLTKTGQTILLRLEMARAAVAETSTHPAWLFLDGLLVGAVGGAAYGNYRTLSRRKSKVLSLTASLLLVAAVLSLMWLVGLFGLPFERI